MRLYMESKKSKPESKGNPNSIPLSLHQKLEGLRQVAMLRLKQNEYMRKIAQAECSALRVLMGKLPPASQDQIWRDVKAYNFYDALAMWLDPVYGLASYYPSEFVAIGEKFLGVVNDSVEKPTRELVEAGVSGHIGSYDMFISGDNVVVVEDWKGGKLYKRVVKGLGDFVKKAGRNLRIGWAEFPDFEVIYIYNAADQNFGYAVNLQVPEFSEWGYAPFEVKGVKSEFAEQKNPEVVRKEIESSSERIEAKKKYRVFTKVVRLSRVGKVRVVISYDLEKPDADPFFLATNCLTWEAKKIVETYGMRWGVETFYRDSKQHLGLEDCQLRNERGIKRHWYLVFVAYTLLRLDVGRSRFSRWINSDFRTIGAKCRDACKDLVQSLVMWCIKMLSSGTKKGKEIEQRKIHHLLNVLLT